MTSEPTQAFVWIWLPGAVDPVVCGRLDDADGVMSFTYARSYLARADAVPIYAPELPLRSGAQFAASGTRLPICLDDAMPDAWGRRLVDYRLGSGTVEHSELTYLLASGSDRFGALDFQESAEVYRPRAVDHPDLTTLARAVELVQDGRTLSPELDAALMHGTSIGGARPKTLLNDGPRGMIAKFSSASDIYPVVQGEYIAMELARLAGLDVAPVSLARVAGKYVLLIERFDRPGAGRRHRVVSALSILGLSAYPEGRYASYTDLADRIRADFVEPDRTLRELLGRISMNILTGNTDDHARNHAALIEGEALRLSPAYDICPQPRSGTDAYQAMAFTPDGRRESHVTALIDAAHVFHLDTETARELVDKQIAAIEQHWDDVCDRAELTADQRDSFRGTQFLNQSAV